MGATEARDPLLAYQMNSVWAGLDNSVDDDQSWASATQANVLGMLPHTATQALYAEGNNPQLSVFQTRFTNLP